MKPWKDMTHEEQKAHRRAHMRELRSDPAYRDKENRRRLVGTPAGMTNQELADAIGDAEERLFILLKERRRREGK